MLSAIEIERYLKDDLINTFGPDESRAIIREIIHCFCYSSPGLSHDELESIRQRILNHEPVAYITGRCHFATLELNVSPAVFIPRPETEELVFLIKERLTPYRYQHLKALDVGTGSGAIAIALKKFFPAFAITAIDISQQALAVARENALQHHTPVEFHCINILETDVWNSFDVVVSNPPYVPFSEKETMDKAVVNYEPHEALFVSNSDPLLFYKKIIDLSTGGLCRPEGWLFFEVHYQHGQHLLPLMHSAGFHQVELLKDLSGNYRFVIARKR
jgi:release factor glutamine methyltransferase